MFSKNKKKLEGSSSQSTADAPKSSPSKPLAPSIISQDLRIFGDVSSDGEIQIDGSIEGDIRTDVLLVGQSAVIKGEIVADKVNVHGKINGQIKARKVFLAKESHVTGDILHEDLSIEAGAYLEGLCKRISIKKEAPENKMNLVAKDSDKDRIKNLGISTMDADIATEASSDEPEKAKG